MLGLLCNMVKILLVLLLCNALQAHLALAEQVRLPADSGHRELVANARQRAWQSVIDAQQLGEFLKKANQKTLDCKELKWLQDYIKWHNAERAHVGQSTQFMSYFCDDSNHQRNGIMCGGVGDRFRGLEEAVKLAVHSKRLFLASWITPLPLETFFVPADINWSASGMPLNVTRDSRVYKWHTNKKPHTNLTTPAFTQIHKDVRSVAMSSGWFQSKKSTLIIPGPDLGGVYSPTRRCLFKAMFKPSPGLDARIRQAKTELFGTPDAKYVAMHLRLGGMDGEPQDITRFNPLKGMLAALACGQRLAAAHNISRPLLVLTDNVMLRAMIQDGQLAGVVSPNATPHHMSSHTTSVDDHMSTFVDLGLLAGAHCLLASPSGFSYMAAQWGGNPCVQTLEACFGVIKPLAN